MFCIYVCITVLQWVFISPSAIFALFVQTVYNRVAQGMLHDDRIVLAMLLSRLFLKIESRCVNSIASVFD